MDINIYIWLGLGIIIGFIIGFLISKIYFLIKLKNYGKKATKSSRAAILGEVNEKIAPLLPNFKYNPKDLVFIGKGIDYIVFDGLSKGALKQIIFLEVKSGKSTLNANERQIKNIINKKKFKYEIFNIK